MAFVLTQDTVVFILQAALLAYSFHRGLVLGYLFLAPTALYWVTNESVPLSFKILCGICGSMGLVVIGIGIPYAIWNIYWRCRFRNRALRAFGQGDFQHGLFWIEKDKARYGTSRDHYSCHAQLLNGMKQFSEALRVLETAEDEGFHGTNLTWPRVWALCRLNRHDEALTHLESLISEVSEIELQYIVLLIYYARVYVDMKQIENASEVIHNIEDWMRSYRHRLPIEDKNNILRVFEECKSLYDVLDDQDSRQDFD